MVPYRVLTTDTQKWYIDIVITNLNLNNRELATLWNVRAILTTIDLEAVW